MNGLLEPMLAAVLPSEQECVMLHSLKNGALQQIMQSRHIGVQARVILRQELPSVLAYPINLGVLHQVLDL